MARKFTLLSKSALASAASALGLAAEAGADLPPEDQPNGDAPAGDPPATLDEHGNPITPPAPDGDPEEGPDAAAQVVTVADASAHASEQFAAGRAAANTRWSTVFASAEAVANPAMAAFLCINAPDASAESIVGQLKAMPGASAPAPAPAAQVIPDTDIDLSAGDPLAALDVGAEQGDVWADSSKRVFGAAAGLVTSSDAGPSYMPVTQGGMSLTTPTMPAGVPPTGN